MKSESLNELAKALCDAQKELKPALKDAKNTFYNSSYADLASVTEAVRSIHAHGLSYTQTLDMVGETPVLKTTLLHVSGQWVEGVQPLMAVKKDPQSLGSAITFARRYGLAAIVGLTQDDDDGNAASLDNFDDDFAEEDYTKDSTPPKQATLFKPISPKQRGWLYSIVDQLQWGPEEAKAWLLKQGYKSSNDIPSNAFNGILKKLEAEQKKKAQ